MKYKTLISAAQEVLLVLREPLKHIQSELSDSLQSLYEIQKIVQEVYEKPGTNMGDYWISFLEMSDPLVKNIHACHTQNYDEYKLSSFEMLPGLMAYNNHEYARNLPDFWAMLCNLPEEQSPFFSLHFVQSMTGLPYS